MQHQILNDCNDGNEMQYFNWLRHIRMLQYKVL